MTWFMHLSKTRSRAPGLVTVAVTVAVVAACTTERNLAVCCTTIEDCAALGVDGPEGWECASGRVCIRNICVATECQAASDCPATAPICSPDQMCVECVDSSDCASGGCNASTNTCSSCLSNSECASGVCSAETGACASTSSIVYTAPGAPAASDCLQSAPCSIKTALTVASTHPDRSIVLMAPGNYPTNIGVAGGNPITILGEAATITSTSTDSFGLQVSDGADVTIIGLTITTLVTNPQVGVFPILCSSSNGPRTKLRLVSVSAFGTPTQGFYAGSEFRDCYVMLSQVTMRQTQLNVANSTIVIDQSRLLNVSDLVGTALNVLSSSQGTSTLTMTNSVLGGGLSINGNQTVNVSFSTIYGCEGPAYTILGCNRGVEWINPSGAGLSFRNNVISGQMVADSVSCPNCSSLQEAFVNNITFPQTAPIPGNFIASPQLVNPANHDFRLRPGSLAIDAADAVTTDHDLTGVARPVGPRADLGAFEFSP